MWCTDINYVEFGKKLYSTLQTMNIQDKVTVLFCIVRLGGGMQVE